MPRQPFSLVVASQVEVHLEAIETKHHGMILCRIRELLLHEPDVPPRNRKKLREPIHDADWEIRFGPNNRFRAFYRFDLETRIVELLAVGEKIRNRLVIGGEETT